MVKDWQDKAGAEWRAAADDLSKAHSWWDLVGDALHLKDAAVESGIALYDESRAAAAFIAYGTLEAAAYGLRALADLAEGTAQAARGAARAAGVAARLADVAAQTAHSLAAVAAQEAAIAVHDDAVTAGLAAAYARQMARKVLKAARAVARVLKKAAKVVARAAVTVAKAAYKYSGAQDVVSCVTHPQLSSCVKAALTVALVVGTAAKAKSPPSTPPKKPAHKPQNIRSRPLPRTERQSTVVWRRTITLSKMLSAGSLALVMWLGMLMFLHIMRVTRGPAV